MSEPTQAVTQGRKRIFIWGLITLAVALVFIGYLIYDHYYPSTDDAYVQAHVINIAPQVSGPVSAIYVHNYQIVKKGQPLFNIDPRPFQIAVEQARAQLELARQEVGTKEQAIEVARANVAQAQAQLVDDQKNHARTADLVRTGQVSIASGDNSYAQYKESEANLKAAQSSLQKALRDLGTPGEQNAEIQKAVSNLHQAELNLSYTHVAAPASGKLINFNARSGDMLTSGQNIFSIVEEYTWWIQANFKETDLARIQPGQAATISVDTYPLHKFKGIVQSISSGSGAAFSMLPPENATGNWVKVTQRFEVKIMFKDPGAKYPLRVGASSTVRVNTLANRENNNVMPPL